MYVGRRADVTRMMSQVWWIAFGCDATILNENVKMWRVSGVGTIVRAPLRRAPEKRGSATEKKKKEREKKIKIAACRHLYGSHTKYQAITTGNGGIMSVQVLRRDWTRRRRISCRIWVTILGGLLEVFENVWHKMNIERQKQKQNNNTPLYVWDEMMRIEWQHETLEIRKAAAITI